MFRRILQKCWIVLLPKALYTRKTAVRHVAHVCAWKRGSPFGRGLKQTVDETPFSPSMLHARVEGSRVEGSRRDHFGSFLIRNVWKRSPSSYISPLVGRWRGAKNSLFVVCLFLFLFETQGNPQDKGQHVVFVLFFVFVFPLGALFFFDPRPSGKKESLSRSGGRAGPKPPVAAGGGHAGGPDSFGPAKLPGPGLGEFWTSGFGDLGMVAKKLHQELGRRFLGPCFHFPGFHFGYIFLTHSHLNL